MCCRLQIAPCGESYGTVTADLAESNGSLLPGLWRDSFHVTCGLTACTPGSAPGPTLGNEYGKTLPLPLISHEAVITAVCTVCHATTRRRHANSRQLSLLSLGRSQSVM